MVIHCTHCGHRFAAAARFCPACGAHPPGNVLRGNGRDVAFLPGPGVTARTRRLSVSSANAGHWHGPSLNLPQAERSSLAGGTAHAHFLALEERGPGATLECPRCADAFDVDAYTGENLVIDRRTKRQLAVCPFCGTVED